MILYAKSEKLDIECFFEEEKSEEYPFLFYILDEIVLDFTFDGNIQFYDEELEGQVISTWMKENPSRVYNQEAGQILREEKITAGRFKNGVMVLDTRKCIRKPEIHDLAKIQIEVLSPDEFSSRFRNQEIRSLPYTQDTQDIWQDIFHSKRFNFLCFITASIHGYLIGLSKVMESDTSTEDDEWLATAFVSVHEDWRGHGIGRMLKEKAFQLSADLKTGLCATRYSTLGLERLKHINHELSKKYNVKFEDEDSKK